MGLIKNLRLRLHKKVSFARFLLMSESFKTLLLDMTQDERQNLADVSGTSLAYLHHIANGYRRAGAKVLPALLRADDRITLESLEACQKK